MSRRKRITRRQSCTAGGLLVAAIIALAGCIVDSSGRPLGADTAHSLARQLHVAPARHACHSHDGHGVYCAEACCETDEYATANGPDIEPPDSAIETGAGEDDEDYVGHPPDIGDDPPFNGEPCDDQTHASHVGMPSLPLDAFGTLLSVASVPASAVGGIANACFPSQYLGPPELPPPSRFNPVPTRPVFAPLP